MKQAPHESLWLSAVALAGMALCMHGRARATETSELDGIRRVAERTVLSQAASGAGRLSASAAALDPRLQLAACAVPLRGQLAGDGQLREAVSVAVRCEQPVRWTVYVRVAVRAEVPVLVARHLVPQGATLAAADLEQRTQQVEGTGSRYPASLQAIGGVRLRRPLAAGELVSSDMLEQLPLIRRGQQVTLLARSPGLDIRVAAQALADGRADERIRVQNLNSRQIVEGVVRGADLVEVPL